MDMHPNSSPLSVRRDATTSTCERCTGKCKAAMHVLKSVADMRKDGDLCDLVLEVGASQFRVHRLVLCVWSPVVRTLLLQQNAIRCALTSQASQTQYHVQIGFGDSGVFEQFVNYLYTGDVPEQAINVPAVLLLAASFKVIQLQQYCEELLKATLNIENMISVHRLATKFSLKGLEVSCLEFLRMHAADIVQTNEFRKLQPEQINAFLGSERMLEMDPEIKLFLIISWLTEEVANRQQFLVILLSHIDWSVVAADFLLEISQTDNFFTCNPSSLYLLLQTLHSSSISLGPYEDQFEDLKSEYSYLLASVVSSSVALGPSPTPQFQPVTMSLIPSRQQGQKTAAGNKLVDVEPEPGSQEAQALHSDKDGLAHLNLQGLEKANSLLATGLPPSHTVEGDSVQIFESQDNSEADELGSNADSQYSESLFEGGARKRKNLRPRKLQSEVSASPIKQIKLDFPLTRSARKRPIKFTEDVKRKNSKDVPRKNSKQAANEKQESPGRKQKKSNTNDNSNNTTMKPNKSEISSNKKQSVSVVKQVSERKNTRAKTRTRSVKSEEGSLQFNDKAKKLGEASESQSQAVPSLLKRSLDQAKINLSSNNETKLKNDRPLGLHEGNMLLTCDLCSFTSNVDLKYYRHLASSHFPGPPHKCDQQDCHFTAPCIKQLSKHRTQHGDRRPFVCTICLQAFRAKNNLYAHIKVHSDERQFECPECGRFFKQKNTLDQHMVIHSDLRPYLCDLCGFSTKFQNHFISHKKIHSGEVFHCKFPSCLYSTPKRSQLKAHMRSHLGIRTHVCSTCGKAFVEKSHLIRHERIHSSERGYSCPDCSYTSTRLDKLKEHQQKHHSSAKTGTGGSQIKDGSGSGGKAETPGKKKKAVPSGKRSGPERHSLSSKEGQGNKTVTKGDIVEVVVMKGNNPIKKKPSSKPVVHQMLGVNPMQHSLSGHVNQEQQSFSPSGKGSDLTQSINSNTPVVSYSHCCKDRNVSAGNPHGAHHPSAGDSLVHSSRHNVRDVANFGYSDMNSGSYSQNMNFLSEASHSAPVPIAEMLPQMVMPPPPPPPPQAVTGVSQRGFQDIHPQFFNVNAHHVNTERQYMHNFAEQAESHHLQEQFPFLFEPVPQASQRFPLN